MGRLEKMASRAMCREAGRGRRNWRCSPRAVSELPAARQQIAVRGTFVHFDTIAGNFSCIAMEEPLDGKAGIIVKRKARRTKRDGW